MEREEKDGVCESPGISLQPGEQWGDCSVAVDSGGSPVEGQRRYTGTAVPSCWPWGGGDSCQQCGNGAARGFLGMLFIFQNSSRKPLIQVFFLVETPSCENCPGAPVLALVQLQNPDVAQCFSTSLKVSSFQLKLNLALRLFKISLEI